MTEFGRRGAIMVGTAALTVSVLVGLFSGGDLAYVVVQGLAAALAFGVGGLLIGNVLHNYIITAANREVARRQLERELAMEMEAARLEGESSEADVPVADAEATE